MWSAPLPALGLGTREPVLLNGHVDSTALVLAEPLQSWAATGSRANMPLRALGVDGGARDASGGTLDGLPYDRHTLPPPSRRAAPRAPRPASLATRRAIRAALSSDAWCLDPAGAAPLALSLRDAAIALITPDGAASSSPSVWCFRLHGDLFVLTLRTDGRGVCAIDFLRVASSVPASTICALGDARGSTFIFLGSRVADSLLLQLGLRAADGGRRAAAPAIGGAAKRLRADDGDGGDGDDALEEDDEEDALSAPLAVAAAASSSPPGGRRRREEAATAAARFSRLACRSPTRVTRGAGTAAATRRRRRGQSGAAVLMCGGRGRSGSLSVATGVRLTRR